MSWRSACDFGGAPPISIIMKAIVLEQFGGIENLITKEIDVPKIKAGEILIKSKAIGINPVDYKTRKGQGAATRLKLPVILGWDVAGEVVEVNKNSQFKVGDAVFGMVNFPGEGKTYAEYVVAPEEHITIKPKNISFTEAAAIPLVALTAYQTLIKEGNIGKNSRVFIQGAAGGVGHMAVQIAKSAGAYVIATASTENKKFVLNLGADEVIDYTKENFEDMVKNVDVALDCVGGDIAIKTINVVKEGGKMISTPSPVDKKLHISHLGVKTPWVLVHSSKKDIEYVANLIESGKLKVHIQKIFSFAEIGKAHKQLENESNAGKIVVSF